MDLHNLEDSQFSYLCPTLFLQLFLYGYDYYPELSIQSGKHTLPTENISWIQAKGWGRLEEYKGERMSGRKVDEAYRPCYGFDSRGGHST